MLVNWRNISITLTTRFPSVPVAGLAGRLQFSELNLPIPQVPAIVVGVVDDDQGEYRRHMIPRLRAMMKS